MRFKGQCGYCGGKFETNLPYQRYCSAGHQIAAASLKNRRALEKARR